MPHKDVSEDKDGGETADLINLNSESPPPTPPRSYKRLQSEDNQYISMSRSSTLNPELLQQLALRPKDQGDAPPDPEDDDPTGGYLTMRSCPINLQQQLEQLAQGREGENPDVFTVGLHRETVPSYATVRQRIQSAPGEPQDLINTSNTVLNLPDPLLPISSSVTDRVPPTTTAISSQYSFATATMNEGGTGNAALGKSSAQEALVPSSVRFIYQRPTATTASSTGGNGRPGEAGPDAPQVPRRPGHGQDQSPRIQRANRKSESDATALGILVPPAIPPRVPSQQHQQQEQAAGGQIQPKAKKPPMPPPRRKSNPVVHDIAQLFPKPKPPPSPRAHSGAAAAFNEAGMRLQTLILSDPEFQSCTPEVCKQALEMHNYEMKAAKEEIRVHMLMEMQVAHIDPEDCRRALSHCQQKTDRAAAWLLEQSDDIERRRH